MIGRWDCLAFAAYRSCFYRCSCVRFVRTPHFFTFIRTWNISWTTPHYSHICYDSEIADPYCHFELRLSFIPQIILYVALFTIMDTIIYPYYAIHFFTSSIRHSIYWSVISFAFRFSCHFLKVFLRRASLLTVCRWMCTASVITWATVDIVLYSDATPNRPFHFTLSIYLLYFATCSAWFQTSALYIRV